VRRAGLSASAELLVLQGYIKLLFLYSIYLSCYVCAEHLEQIEGVQRCTEAELVRLLADGAVCPATCCQRQCLCCVCVCCLLLQILVRVFSVYDAALIVTS